MGFISRFIAQQQFRTLREEFVTSVRDVTSTIRTLQEVRDEVQEFGDYNGVYGMVMGEAQPSAYVNVTGLDGRTYTFYSMGACFRTFLDVDGERIGRSDEFKVYQAFREQKLGTALATLLEELAQCPEVKVNKDNSTLRFQMNLNKAFSTEAAKPLMAAGEKLFSGLTAASR